MRAFSMMLFGVTIWSVLMAVGISKMMTPIVIDTLSTIATALEPR